MNADPREHKTQSIKDIITLVENKEVMLPAFQRTFVWELEKSCELFDSIVKDIFIGSIIYGKTESSMGMREINTKKRITESGKLGSKSAKSKAHNSETYNNNQKGNTTDKKLILDGQQRVTALCRALMQDCDEIWFVVDRKKIKENFNEATNLKDYLQEFSSMEDSNTICIKLSDVGVGLRKVGRVKDQELRTNFMKSKFVNQMTPKIDMDSKSDVLEKYFKIYETIFDSLTEVFKDGKLIVYFILSMDLEMFPVFFERSNTQGIVLNFTDILAAKLFSREFDLHKKMEELEDKKYNFNAEVLIRAIAFITKKIDNIENKGRVDQSYILKKLETNDFKNHWDNVVKYYKEVIDYLLLNHYIISSDKNYLPSINLILPLIMFVKEHKKGFSNIDQKQKNMIQYWFWGSIFSKRYSSSSNEKMIEDAEIFEKLAQKKEVKPWDFNIQIRAYEDLYEYQTPTNIIYKGILNLIHHHQQGLLAWTNTDKLQFENEINDHHIFPKAYIKKTCKGESTYFENKELCNSIVNRTWITGLNNRQIGSKSPKDYVKNLFHSNKNLEESLQSHLFPEDFLTKSYTFDNFLKYRARKIFEIIEKHTKKNYSDTNQTLNF